MIIMIEDDICSFQLSKWTFRIDILNKEIKTTVLFAEMDYGLITLHAKLSKLYHGYLFCCTLFLQLNFQRGLWQLSFFTSSGQSIEFTVSCLNHCSLMILDSLKVLL